MSTKSQIIDYFMQIYSISFDDAEDYYDLGFRTYADLWNYDKLPQHHRDGIYWRAHLDQNITKDEAERFVALIANSVDAKVATSQSTIVPLAITSPKIVLTGALRRGIVSKEIEIITDDPNGISNLLAKISHLDSSVIVKPGKTRLADVISSPTTMNPIAHHIKIIETTSGTFGFNLLETTGPPEFVNLILDRANKLGKNIRAENQTLANKEVDIFHFLDLTYVEPEQRTRIKRLPLASFAKDAEPTLGRMYYLVELVCGSVSSHHDTCNSISAKISNSLIRVAATRIFSNPFQSIMEPIANSIDSYRRMYGVSTNSIGKFGMGFFSLFYWLVGNSDRKLSITSQTKIDAWSGDFFEHKNDLVIRFNNNFTRIFKPGQTGTNIKLGLFPFDMIDNFREYIRRFALIDDIEIYYTENLTTLPPETKPRVIVFFDINKATKMFTINIIDNAEGITKSILRNSLIVPSSSTKGLISTHDTIESEQSFSYMFDDIITTKGLHLLIVINSIIVVDTVTSTKESQLNYIIYLPYNTPLPVSRDDIIIDEKTFDMLLEQFKFLAELCIEGGYNLEDFFILLRTYAQYSGQPQIYDIIQQTRQHVTELPNIILVPSQRLVTLLRSLGKRVAYLTDVNVVKTKQQLDETFDEMYGAGYGTDIFKNIRVIRLPGTFSATNAGISGYIFIDQRVNDPNTLIDSYNGAILQKINEISPSFDLDKFFKDATFMRPERRMDFGNLNFGAVKFYRVRRMKGDSPYGGEHMSGTEELVRRDKDHKGFTQPVFRPEFLVSDFVSFHKDGFTDLFNLLHSSVEAWVYSLGHSVILLVDSIEIGQNSDNLSQVDKIFLLCCVNIYVLKDMTNHNKVTEYIMSLCQFFTRAKINVAQGTQRIINIFRNTRFHTLLNVHSNIDLFNLGKQYLTLTAKERLIDSFFITLNANFDDGELKNTIVLNDARYFPIIEMMIFWNNIDRSDPHFNISDMYQVIEKTKSGFEAYIIYKSLNLIKDARLIANLLSTIDMIIAEMHKRFPATYFTQYLSESPDANNEQWLVENVCRPLSQAATIFLNYINTNTICQTIAHASGEIIGQFNLKKLIDYVYDNEVELETLTDITTLSNNIQQYIASGKVNLQVIEIAVNEGTSKPFVDSVLTELIQNSVDAINQAIAVGRAVQENINVNYCTQHDTFQLSVQDFVGIPVKALLPLLITFFSSKSVTPSDDALAAITTGEMGTGFFNVYRQPWCREVIIQSGELQIIAVPQIYQDRVVDIVYTFMKIETKPYTNIIINSNVLSAEALVDVSLNMYIFANNSLSLISKPIIFNNRPLQVQLKTIYESDTGTIKLVVGDGEISVATESMLLTNGIPLGPLSTFIENITGEPMNNPLLFTNVVVNINKRYYLPVQSRNRINLDVKKRKRIHDFLQIGLGWIMAYKLTKVSDVIFEKYLPGGSSKSSLDQFSFALQGFQILHRQSNNTISDSISIHENIDKIVGDIDIVEIAFSRIMIGYRAQKVITITNENNRAFVNQFFSQHLPDVMLYYNNSPIEDMINRWFSTKRMPIVRNIQVNNAVKTQIPSVVGPSSSDIQNVRINRNEQLGLCMGIFQTFTNVFYQIGRQLKLVGAQFSFTPTIKVGDSGSDNYAIYMSGEHQVVFNEKHLTRDLVQILNDWSKYIELLRQHERVKARIFLSNSVLKYYIGNTLAPSATLPHELFHSITGTSHGSGAHNNHTLIINDEEFPNIPYDECVAKIYTSILVEGFIDELLKYA